jgi:outer membrane lipase/esterase
MQLSTFARRVAGLCLVVCCAQASAYSQLVVFGDSISDSGNNANLIGVAAGQVITGDTYFARVPYASGTYTNGKVWTQYLAESLGVSMAPSIIGGSNFAFGGAQTGLDGADVPAIPGFPFSMRSQLGMYLGATGGVADPNALYVVAGGGNNIRVALEDIGAGANPLQAAGAHHILVVNTPNFGLTPLAGALGVRDSATGLSFAMDSALGARLASEGPDVRSFDLFSFLSGTVAAGSASGFSNLTHACGAAVNACDPNTALFFDAIHPTTLAQERLALAVLAVAVPEPEQALLWVAGLLVVGMRMRARAQAAAQRI